MIGNTNSLIGETTDYENFNITLITNQSDHTDLIGSKIIVNYADKEDFYTYEGNLINIQIPAYADYIISFSNIEGYKTPNDITGTAIANNSKTIFSEYKTEIVSISSNVNNAPINVNGVKYIYNNTPIIVKIAFGTNYQIIPENFNNLYTTDSFNYIANQANRSVSINYFSSTLKLQITSNTPGNSLIYNSKVKVNYGSTTVEITNDQEINIPINTNISLTFPGHGVNGYKGSYNNTTFIADYTTTITSNGGQKFIQINYETVLLRVTVTSDGTMPTGYTINISQDGGPSYIQNTSTATHKIIPGVNTTISASDVDGYGTPTPITNSYTSTSTVEVQYTENTTGVYIRTVGGKDIKWDSWSESVHGRADLIVIKSDKANIALNPYLIPVSITGISWSVKHNNTLVPGITSVNQRGNDYLGKENTDALRQQYMFDNGNESAFSYASTIGNNYYLGATGEWYILGDNIDDVRSALNKVGSDLTFEEDYISYWTSTQNGANHAYVHYFYPDSAGVSILKSSTADGIYELRTVLFYKV